MTVENFRRHVDQLSAAFGIEIEYSDELERHEAMALRLEKLTLIHQVLGINGKWVLAHPIDDETSYVIVVHELGHHLAPNGYCNKREPGPGSHPRKMFEYFAAKLVAEEAAWEWAQYYVEQVFIWTAAMESVKQHAFSSYLEARRTGR